MRDSNAREPAVGWAHAPLYVLWAAALLAPAAVFALAIVFPHGELLRDAVAAMFLLAIAVVGSSGSALHALVTAFASFVLYRVYVGQWASATPAFAPNDAVVLVSFLSSAALVAWIASGRRRQIATLTLRQAHGSLRRELAERLAGEQDEVGVVRSAIEFLERSLRCKAVLWLGDRGFYSGAGEIVRPPEALDAPAESNGWSWIPLNGVDGRLGAVGFARDGRRSVANDELAHSLSADIAHSVVRARLTAELQQERVANESERLCTALLASVSHDLRTPLTTIMGAAESLRSFGDSMPDDDRIELLSTIEIEGRRLDRYIQNLVDVTRIGDGRLAMDVEPTTVDELIASAVGRLRRYEPDVRLEIRVDANVPPVRVHAPLIEQALFNVLHNASKFSPPGHAIVVHAGMLREDTVAVDVIDAGPGIPHAERERVFDMFYSADRGDPARSGTGLGLAISQSIIRAHGGEVTAHSGSDGIGTRMRLVLPLAPVGTESCA